MSLAKLNKLPEPDRRRMYGEILPPRFWQYLASIAVPSGLNLAGGYENPRAMHLLCPPDRNEIHLRCPAERFDRDFAFSLDLEEIGGGQLELSFIIINDITAPRFNIDVDGQGRLTLLGTAGRNIPEEARALAAGLGPCQVRKGLGLFTELLPRLESLGTRLGYVGIQLEALTYHNAVMYENHGFGYLEGQSQMIEIDREFRPGGKLHELLNGSSSFRLPQYADTAHGRSWAIHDSILEDYNGESQPTLQLYKVFGKHAGVTTFQPPQK